MVRMVTRKKLGGFVLFFRLTWKVHIAVKEYEIQMFLLFLLYCYACTDLQIITLNAIIFCWEYAFVKIDLIHAMSWSVPSVETHNGLSSRLEWPRRSYFTYSSKYNLVFFIFSSFLTVQFEFMTFSSYISKE